MHLHIKVYVLKFIVKTKKKEKKIKIELQSVCEWLNEVLRQC